MPVRLAVSGPLVILEFHLNPQDCAASALHNPIQSIGCFHNWRLIGDYGTKLANILIVTFLVIEAPSL